MALGAAGAAVLHGLLRKLNKENVGNTRLDPSPRPAKRSMETLYDGYEKEARAQGIENPAAILLKENVPPSDLSVYDNILPYADNGIDPSTGQYKIRINPEANEVNLAHELGHVVSRQTPVGKVIRDLRDNPKLTNALFASAVGLPVLTSAMEEGDDDMDTAILAALATRAPEIIDETAANVNAYNLMNKAGKRGMSTGQMGRMAGGYLSYLALPLLAGTAGNVLGNQFD